MNKFYDKVFPVKIKWKDFHVLTFTIALFLFLLILLLIGSSSGSQGERLSFIEISLQICMVFFLLFIPLSYIISILFYGLVYYFFRIYDKFLVPTKKNVLFLFFLPLASIWCLIISLFIRDNKFISVFMNNHNAIQIFCLVVSSLGILMNLFKMYLLILNFTSIRKDVGFFKSLIICLLVLFFIYMI
jgi:hypothetical protein